MRQGKDAMKKKGPGAVCSGDVDGDLSVERGEKGV